MEGIAFRHFRESDYDAVCDFLIALNGCEKDHINWSWARFEWMYEHPEFDRAAKGSIGLWLDGDRIVGAAIYDMYFGEAFCAALPEYGALYPEILSRAWRELRDETGLAVAICDESAGEKEAAEALGFLPAEQTETVMRRELDELPPAALPEGFSMKSLDPEKEGLRELQWLFWQGFDHGDDLAEFEKDYEKTMRAGLRRRPHFDPALSLTAVGPDGTMAAYVCLWYDARTDYAYLEPLCSTPACRGKGLAKALVYEALRCAKALGAKRAYVISDMPFYEKLGFRIDRHYTFYHKAAEAQKQKPSLETDRLIIDSLRPSDREDYFTNISHDKKVLETFICRYAESLEEFDFSSYLENETLFAIRLKETDRLIGIILYFDEDGGSCEIGYGLGSRWWGRGYATEAVGRFIEYLFREKGFQTVFASFFTGNDASRHVMEKCGMTFSRLSEKELTYLGVERDLSYYSVTRPQNAEND